MGLCRLLQNKLVPRADMIEIMHQYTAKVHKRIAEESKHEWKEIKLLDLIMDRPWDFEKKKQYFMNTYGYLAE